MFRGGIGAPEILLILAVVVLLFGAKKLPDLARGSGRALRIFKAETKGLLDDDDRDTHDGNGDGIRDSQKTEAQRQVDAQQRVEAARRVEAERLDSSRPDASTDPRRDTER